MRDLPTVTCQVILPAGEPVPIPLEQVDDDPLRVLARTLAFAQEWRDQGFQVDVVGSLDVRLSWTASQDDLQALVDAHRRDDA